MPASDTALAQLPLAADVYAHGSTLAEHWNQLLQRYGALYYRSGYFVASPPSRSAAVFERLRVQVPASIGDYAVEAVRDLGTGIDTAQPGVCTYACTCVCGGVFG